MPVKLFKKHKQVQLKYSKKKTDDRCCTFVSRIEGGWEHINDLWNAKWKQQITFDLLYKATTVPNVVIHLKLALQSTLKKTHVIKPFVLRIFTKRTDCQVCFIALKDLFVLNVIRHWFSHCVMCAVLPGSPFLAWRHGTRHLWCLSPNPDRPKAQIPACYSNMMQPVEDKDFSHWKASYYMLQWSETGHDHNRFALNVLTAPSPGACWGLTQSVHCEHKYVIWALHAVSPPPLWRTNSLAVCFAYHPSVRKVGQKK